MKGLAANYQAINQCGACPNEVWTMKKAVYFCLALLALGPCLLGDETLAGDLYLEGTLASGAYATENGGIIARASCVVESGASVTLIADRFAFQPGFRARAGSRLVTLFPDYDGLSDAWEVEYFGSLERQAGDDADSDGMTNLQEYQCGTNPTVYATDHDGDSLLDLWELSYFSNLSQGAGGDADGDGYTNYIEHKLETNPTDSNNYPAQGVHNKYDILGRVTAALKLTGQSLQYEIEYSYDSVGNRTRKAVNNAP
jgi:hypothetical protein